MPTIQRNSWMINITAHVNYDCFEVLHVFFLLGENGNYSFSGAMWKSIIRDRRCVITRKFWNRHDIPSRYDFGNDARAENDHHICIFMCRRIWLKLDGGVWGWWLEKFWILKDLTGGISRNNWFTQGETNGVSRKYENTRVKAKKCTYFLKAPQ